MSRVWKEAILTCEVSSAVSVLLQDVALPTATAMGAGTVLTQLVARAPHGAVVKVFSIKQKKGQQITPLFPLCHYHSSQESKSASSL